MSAGHVETCSPSSPGAVAVIASPSPPPRRRLRPPHFPKEDMASLAALRGRTCPVANATARALQSSVMPWQAPGKDSLGGGNFQASQEEHVADVDGQNPWHPSVRSFSYFILCSTLRTLVSLRTAQFKSGETKFVCALCSAQRPAGHTQSSFLCPTTSSSFCHYHARAVCEVSAYRAVACAASSGLPVTQVAVCVPAQPPQTHSRQHD